MNRPEITVDWRRWLSVCLLVLLLPHHGRAENSTEATSLFIEARSLPAPVLLNGVQPVSRRLLGRLNPAAFSALSSGVRPDQPPIRLTMLPDRPEVILIRGTQGVGGRLQRCSASLEGDPDSRVHLVQRDGLLAGSILSPGRDSFQMTPLGGESYEINQLNLEQLPVCALTGPARTGDAIAKMGRPALETLSAPRRAAIGGDVAIDPIQREVELMVVYTGQAKAAVGVATLEMLIQVSVDEANAAFQNSQTGVRLRLVHLAEIDYRESGDLAADLAALRTPQDGLMDEVHPLRESHEADLVCLVVENSNRYNGIASFPTGPEGGFCVVDRFHLTGFGLLGHEIGHNFGCDHDRENATGGGSFPYSFGHRVEVGDRTYRTIMCYAPGWPIAQFSNPDIAFQGVPTGIPAGEPDEADNARTIREMAGFVDAYMGFRVTLTQPHDGDSFTAGTRVDLSADVSTTEGPVQRLDFFLDGNLLGQITEAPFVWAWTNATPGRHALTAQAISVQDSFTQISREVTIGVKPPNDDFSQRIVLTGSDVTTGAMLYAATLEPGEPTPSRAGGTAWWTWPPIAAGTVRLATLGSGATRDSLAVYTGDAIETLSLVAQSSLPNSDLLFEAVPGVDYHIALRSNRPEYLSQFLLTTQSAPGNDNFEDATTIVAAGTAVQGSTVAATRQAQEPAIGRVASGHSVWYSWKASAAGRITVSLVGSDQTSVPDFAIFTGSDLANLLRFASSTEAGLGVAVNPGQTYWIGVDGPHTRFSLVVNFALPPPNDAFARRILIPGSISYLSVNNLGATREPGEPQHGSLGGSHSQWWSWRAPSDGGVQLTRSVTSLAGPTAPITVAVYRGTSLPELIPVAGFDFTNRGTESFSFPVQRGTNYSIAVDSPSTTDTRQSLRFEVRGRPVNDNFKQRQTASASLQATGITTLGATSEPGEPAHGSRPASHSLWWSWTAPSNTPVAFTVDGTGLILPQLAVYTGTSLTNLVRVADNLSEIGPVPTILIPAGARTTYQLALDEASSSFVSSLSIRSVSPPQNDHFENRQVLNLQGQSNGSTVGASNEPTEPDHLGTGEAAPSVWYSFTLPAGGLVAVLAEGRSSTIYDGYSSTLVRHIPEPWLVIYEGNTLAGLTEVARGIGSATFMAKVRVAYQVAVVSRAGRPQDFVVSLTSVPNNDRFRNAFVLTDPLAQFSCAPSQLRSATSEFGEPIHGGAGTGHSLWWTWTPRRSGWYYLSSSSFSTASSVEPALVKAIYTGTNVAELHLVASAVGWAQPTFFANAGVRHSLAVDLLDSQVLAMGRNAAYVRLTMASVPTLSALLRPGWNAIEFTVTGTASQRVQVEISDDLVHWLPARTVTLTSSPHRFYEPPSLGPGQTFYRVVLLL